VPAGGTADRADHKTRTGGACPARADSDGDTGQGKPRPYGMTCIVPGRHSRPYGMRPLRQAIRDSDAAFVVPLQEGGEMRRRGGWEEEREEEDGPAARGDHAGQ